MDTLGAETLTDDAPPSAVASTWLCAGASKSAAGHMNKHSFDVTSPDHSRFDFNCLTSRVKMKCGVFSLTCQPCLLFATLKLLQQTLCFALCMRGRRREGRTRRRRVRRFSDWRGASRSEFSRTYRKRDRRRVGAGLSSTSFFIP